MFRAFLLFVLVVFSLSPAHSQVEWKQFESTDHRFRSEYPGPVLKSKGALPPDVGGNYYDFKCMNVRLVWSFGVQVIEDPYAHKNPTDKQLRARLDRARDSGVSGLDEGKLVSERDLRLNGRVGREFVVENRINLIIARIYYFHNRLYLMMALMRKSVSDYKDFEEVSKRFLNSFEILP